MSINDSHAAAHTGRGRYLITRNGEEIGMLTFAVEVPREAMVVRFLCQALDAANDSVQP